MIDGPAQIHGTLPRGVRFSDGCTFGACVTRVIAGRGIRRFLTDGNTGKQAAENIWRRLRTLNSLILVVFLEARINWSTVENARRRQRTFYPLVSSKALGSGASSGSQTQRIGMLAGERSVVSLKKFSFYIVKWIRDFPAFLCFVR